tara:strand:+ start:2001 stop:2858 length:858 start_codon:yes stop_codon:yes gene_type:complete
MLTFLGISEFGRLGNQLFRYAAVKCLSLHNSRPVVLPHPNLEPKYSHRLGAFNLRCHYVPGEEIAKNIKYEYQQPGFEFDQTFFTAPDNCNFKGYFQSEKFFKDIDYVIRREFTFRDPQIEDYANNYISQLRQLHPGKEIVAFHNRRGDNLPANSNYDTKEGGSFRTNKEDFHPLLTEEYVHKSREEFDNCVFLIFSDNKDDIEWCRENIVGDMHYYSEGHTDLVDLAIMQRCDHNIISNSSFSWWAAWLNKNPEKRIVAPKDWFGKAYAHYNMSDLIPSTWKII